MLESNLLPTLSQDDSVLAAYFFGSRARGNGRADSDLDVAVMLDPKLSEREVWRKRLELGASLAEHSPHQLDLFVLGESDLDLTFRIFQQGIRFFERDRSRVRALEARMVGLYYDYQPFLERYLARTAEHFRAHG